MVGKKICIDCRMIEHSGLGTYLKNLIPRLVELDEDDEFILLGNREKISRNVKCNKEYRIIECNAPIFSIREQVEMLWKIPSNIDLLWIPHFNIPVLYTGKMIVTIHDVFHLAMPKHVGGKHKYLYAEFLFNMVKQKAKKILTVSEFTKLEIQKYLKIPAERICPVHLAADESWFNIPVGERPYERPYIFFVGNVKWHKNILTLLKAFNVVKNDIDCDLVIIGKKDNLKTPDKTLEEEYAKGNGRIVFTGFVSDSKLKQYYKHALFMVFPSRYEGFGLPLLEAMAAGCLVLSSNAASLPEVGGNKVEYFNPNDSIELSRRIVFLYKNRKNLNNKINNGVEYAKLFSWDKCARTTMDNIYDCINE